jgi:hypothetical protein
MQEIIKILETDQIAVHCDIDVIIEKDLKHLVDLPYDIIISKEIGGAKMLFQKNAVIYLALVYVADFILQNHQLVLL